MKTLTLYAAYLGYLDEMKAYRFYPIDFITWLGWKLYYKIPFYVSVCK